ncbi:unnamed protein product [Sphagnum tenellum]
MLRWLQQAAPLLRKPKRKETTDRTKETACESLEADLEQLSLGASENASETVLDTDTEDDGTIKPQLIDVLDEASEFGNTEFEELVLKEGPEQILQLTLQDQADEFMREEISDSDDYADWIHWVSNVEERKTGSRESMICVETPAVLEVQRPDKDENLHNLVMSSECSNDSTRWREISQRIQIEPNLGQDSNSEYACWVTLRVKKDGRYYRKYVKRYSILAGPLFDLTRKDVAFIWDENCEQAYQALKTTLDFSFKLMHRPGLKHANVDALSRNPVGSATDDDDFDQGIQDVTTGVPGEEKELLYIRKGEETEWMGMKRKDRRHQPLELALDAQELFELGTLVRASQVRMRRISVKQGWDVWTYGRM